MPTELLPSAAPYMEHDKEEEFINVTQKYPNGTVLMTDDDPPKEKVGP